MHVKHLILAFVEATVHDILQQIRDASAHTHTPSVYILNLICL